MIGTFIQKIREKQGITQETMASRLKMSRPTYIAIEKNEKSLTIEEAKRIAEIFNLSFSSLINEKEDEKFSTTIVKDETQKILNNSEIRINIPQKNLDKFKEIFLYILSKVGAKPNVGETVIYKLLYFIDFDYYEKYEEQLIGATYIKNHFGPTPVEFKKLVETMVEDNDLEVIKSKYFKHEQKKYLAVREPDLSKLVSARELEHINEVINRLSDKNASELSEYSHQDVPWIVTEDGKPIDYESVFYRTSKTSVRNYVN